MACPRPNGGFTAIPNHLFDAIGKAPFTLSQQSVLLAIIRKTLGFGKKEDDVSASQLGMWCGMARENVTRTLAQLEKMGVITKRRGRYGSIVAIRDAALWVVCKADTRVKSTHVSNPTDASVQPVTQSSVAPTPTIENSKDNQQKKVSRKREEVTLAAYLDDCASRGAKAIPESDPVFNYAKRVDLPESFLELHWEVFKKKRLVNKKRQKDWPQTFRNSVEGNWGALWYINAQGRYALTTAGQQAAREFEVMV